MVGGMKALKKSPQNYKNVNGYKKTSLQEKEKKKNPAKIKSNKFLLLPSFHNKNNNNNNNNNHHHHHHDQD